MRNARAGGADHDGAGVLSKPRVRTVEHILSTAVGEGIEIGAADVRGIRLLHVVTGRLDHRDADAGRRLD